MSEREFVVTAPFGEHAIGAVLTSSEAEGAPSHCIVARTPIPPAEPGPPPARDA